MANKLLTTDLSNFRNQVPAFYNTEGFKLFGITPDSQHTTQNLLIKNHEKHHIFFKKGGLHNHLVHHVLAAYSLGASSERLTEIYEQHASYQRPLPPSKIKITKDNWTEHLGDGDLWTDYLNFFDSVVKEEGLEQSLKKYGFHPKLLPRLVAGALHPVIHIGYGIEFQEPIILAEGLAQTAVHVNRMAPVLDDKFFETKGDYNISITDILREVQKDSRLDNALIHNDDNKISKLMETKAEIVREHVIRWGVPETEEGVNKRIQELYESVTLVYAATAQRPDHKGVKLDFFIMHGLTSVLFVNVLLQHLSIPQRVALLRAHFSAVMSFYISRGRPQLHPELLEDPPKDPNTNPWLDIIRISIAGKDMHAIKVVRSLLKAEETWGPREDNLYLKAARLTVDNIRDTDDWNFAGIGWESAWVE